MFVLEAAQNTQIENNLIKNPQNTETTYFVNIQE